MGKYDESQHDDYIECRKCRSKNAPAGSDGFEKYCYQCGVELKTEQPVEKGDVVTILVDDMHQEGYGLGRTEEGFVILVEGSVPEEVIKAEIYDVRESHARAKKISEDTEKSVEDYKSDEDSEEEERGTRRRDFWGQ